MSYLLFDISGTKTKVAITEDLETFIETKSFPTPKSFKQGMQAIIKAAEEMKSKTALVSAAGGIRGMLNDERTGIENDAILHGWAKQPITETLSKHFKIPVHLENDTAMSGLGEAVYGAGKGVDIMVYHSISTGVGGVKIEHGRIDEASAGFEPGHQVLDIDRTILGEEITPTLENLVSGSGLEARLGMKATDIPQEDLVWEELAEYLAQGLRNTILYWSPEMIVLGGPMITGTPRINLDSIRKYTVEVLDGFVACPFITTAALEEQSGLYGAMAYLKAKIDD